MRAVRLGLATLLFTGVLGAAPLVSPCAAAAQAQGLSRAGLVIEFERKPPRMFCVTFAEESISALELLRRTGLSLALQDFGGGNLAVCSIDGEGCAYPRASCWCKCVNLSSCTIWGFYRLDTAGAWRFSDEGASIATVRDGDVTGWHWAVHTPSGGSPPAPATASRVCTLGQQVTTAFQKAQTDPQTKTNAWPAVAGLAALLAGLAVWSAQRARSRGQQQ